MLAIDTSSAQVHETYACDPAAPPNIRMTELYQMDKHKGGTDVLPTLILHMHIPIDSCLTLSMLGNLESATMLCQAKSDEFAMGCRTRFSKHESSLMSQREK